MRIIGKFTQPIIDLLGLSMPAGTPIYLGEQNIEHMKMRHPYEFATYYSDIEEIVQHPDYVGYDRKNDSIDFVKLYEVDGSYVQIAVRASMNGNYFARTLFSLMTYKAEKYIRSGTLKRFDNS